MVKGPGSVILAVRSVLARRNCMSRTSTGARALDLGDHARHRRLVARARLDVAGLVDVDALERGGEAVGVALAADLAVGDDVDAGPLHVADGDDGGIVLRLLEPRLGHAPDVHAHARHASSTASRGPPASRAADSCRRRWWVAGVWAMFLSQLSCSPSPRSYGERALMRQQAQLSWPAGAPARRARGGRRSARPACAAPPSAPAHRTAPTGPGS